MCKNHQRLWLLLLAALFCLPTLGMAARYQEQEPLVQAAAGTADIVDQINNFSAGSGTTGSFTAVAEGNKVTVSGQMHYRYSEAAPLALDIDAGVTVEWRAEYVSGQSTNGPGLLYLNGAGSFELAEGGLLHNAVINGSGVIYIDSPGFTLNVTGGTILSASRSNYAVEAPASNVTVHVSGGRIEAQNYGGLSLYQAGSSFSITGGEIISLNASSVPAVFSAGSAFVGGGNITSVADGLVVTNPSVQTRIEGGSIYAIGTALQAGAGGISITGGEISSSSTLPTVYVAGVAPILLAGDARISGGDAAAIQLQGGALTMRGNAQIVSGQYGISTLNTNQTDSVNIHIQDNAVIHTLNTAVLIDSQTSPASFTQSGGTLYSEVGYALGVFGAGAIQVTAEGGQMVSADTSAIFVQNDTGNIHLFGGVVVALADGVTAIEVTGSSVDIAANSGFVLGRTAQASSVVENAGGCSLTGDGILAAWSAGASGNYLQYERRDLTLLSERGTATAYWDYNEAGQSGIRYKLDGNLGFVAIHQVTLAEYIPVVDITNVPATITAGKAVQLSGTVSPANASYRKIVWSVAGNSIGASVRDGVLSATGSGTITLTATIENGNLPGGAFTQEFTIHVLPQNPGGSGTSANPVQSSISSNNRTDAVNTGDIGLLPTAILCALLAGASLVAICAVRHKARKP